MKAFVKSKPRICGAMKVRRYRTAFILGVITYRLPGREINITNITVNKRNQIALAEELKNHEKKLAFPFPMSNIKFSRLFNRKVIQQGFSRPHILSSGKMWIMTISF
jgi:hypothetical protein